MSHANGNATKYTDMEVSQGEQSRQSGGSSASSKGRAPVASGEARGRGQKNKQSVEYALKTGLAGGLAGCAV